MGFKENLKMLRKSKGMTQEEFGKLINKTLLTVSRYESGTIFPTQNTLKEICRVFNITIPQIITDIKFQDRKYTFDEIIRTLHSASHIKSIIQSDKEILEHSKKNKFWTEKHKEIEKELNYILKEAEKKDFYEFFKNKNDVKSFINDFFVMLSYDFLEDNKNIKDDDKIKILEDLEKYYFFLISDYKTKSTITHELGHMVSKNSEKKENDKK